MEYLTREQINGQDQKTCETLLKKLLKDPKVDKPLIKHPELLKDADELIDTICYLEDRIQHLQMVANLEKANAARWGRDID